VVNFQIVAKSCKRINLIAHRTDSKLELMSSNKCHKYIQMASLLLSTIRNISYKLELGQGLMKKRGLKSMKDRKATIRRRDIRPRFFLISFFLGF